MKFKIIPITICVLLSITTCKKENKNESEPKITIDTTELKTPQSTDNANKIKDCDDFLDTYETWTDDLITLMAKYKDNPVGLATSQEYINTMMQSAHFLQDWNSIAVSCASNKSYEKRMKAIQRKIEDKQKELGLKN